MTLTTPEVALRPNNVPCGPRSTSIRSRSKNSVSNRRLWVIGMSLRWMPVAESHDTPTQRSPIPLIVKLDEVKFVLVNVTFGSDNCRSEEFWICCFSRFSAVNAETAIGTACSDWAWRWAVTMISSSPTLSLADCANTGDEMAVTQTPANRESLPLIAQTSLQRCPSLIAGYLNCRT